MVGCGVASPANASADHLPFVCVSFFKRSTGCGFTGASSDGWPAELPVSAPAAAIRLSPSAQLTSWGRSHHGWWATTPKLNRPEKGLPLPLRHTVRDANLLEQEWSPAKRVRLLVIPKDPSLAIDREPTPPE